MLAGWSDVDGGSLGIGGLTANNGTVTANGSGGFVITPEANYNGVVALNYTVLDGQGGTSAASLSLTLAPVNDTPKLTGAPPAIAGQVEDTPFVVTKAQLLSGWTDVDGDTLTLSNLVVSGGTIVTNANGTYTLNPTANFNGTMTIYYNVNDAVSARPGSATVQIAAVNDAARISGTSAGFLTENQTFNPGSPATVTGNLDSTDVDNPADSWQAVASATLGNNGYGSFTVSAAGVWSYTLNNANPTVDALSTGQSLSDSFTVRTIDGTSQLVTITINGRTDFSYVAPSAAGADANDFDALHADLARTAWVQQSMGGTGNDVYEGSNLADTIAASEGSDITYGHGGGDMLYGEASYGMPIQMWASGDDLLYGQAGNDTLQGGWGADTLYGGSGNDTLNGDGTSYQPGDLGDFLYGGSGDDTISGYDGNDLIVGGLGIDQLTGGAGADTFLFQLLGDSGDVIWDYAKGIDTLDLSALDADSNIDGDQAFAWGGANPLANGLWMVADGTSMKLFADTDGNAATAEFSLTFVNGAYDPVAQAWAGFVL